MHDVASPPARSQAFHGWWIVGVVFLSQGISVGATAYAYGFFVKPIAAEFGASRMVALLGLTILNLVTGLASPFVGRLLDRTSVRAVLAAGALSLSVGLALLSRATALWQLGLCVATLVGVGACMTGPLTGSTLVSNWFVARRGRALGIAAMGTSCGGLLLAPFVEWLVRELGWRGALAALSVLVAFTIAPAAWFLVSNRPEDRGLHPDGSGIAAPEPLIPGDHVDRSPFRQSAFWLITVAIGLVFAAFSGVMTNLVPFATDLGVPGPRAGALISILAGCGLLGKLSFGLIADRVDGRAALLGAIGLASLGLSLLLGEPPYARLALGVVCMGLSTGGMLPAWGSLLGVCFGRNHFGRVMGLMSGVMLPMTLSGVPFAGFVYDTTGSYTPAFATFLGAFALAALSVLFLRLPPSASRRA